MTQVMMDYRQVSTIRPNKVRPLTSRLLAGVVVVALGGCSAITNPYVGIESSDIGAGGDPVYAVAVQLARDKQDKLRTKRKELGEYELTTGALILGSGIAGLAFAAFGSHTDALLGAGLVGGGAYGASAYIPTAKRKTIYTNGVKAIDCAISATSLTFEGQSFARGGSNTLTDLRANLTTERAGAVAPLSTSLGDQAKFAPVQMRRISRFETRAEQLDTSLSTMRAAALDLTATASALKKGRGVRLVQALGEILGAVSDQIDQARLDPDAALKAMREKSLALVDDANQAAKKIETAALTAENAVGESRDALDEAKLELGSVHGIEGKSEADRKQAITAATEERKIALTDAKDRIDAAAQEARQLALDAATIQKAIEDRTSCLGDLAGGDDDDGSGS